MTSSFRYPMLAREPVQQAAVVRTTVFMELGGPHHTPHFHAYYQEEVGIFSIYPVELVAGSLPKRQLRLVEAWAELHQAELSADLGRVATRKGAESNRAAKIES